MELLDTAIANVALPHIAGGLAVSYDESAFGFPHAQGQNGRSGRGTLRALG
jgi:hypothetical protein